MNEKANKPTSLRRSLTKLGLTVLSLIVINSSLYRVDQTEHVVITQFGKPVRVVLNSLDDNSKIKADYNREGMPYAEGAGLYLKMPFIQDVQRFDRRFLRWNGYPEEVPTRDKKFIWTDFTARWSIADPLKFLRTVNNIDQAQSRLDDIIDNQTRNSITNRDLIEVVRTDNREMQIAEEELKESSRADSVYEGRPKIIREIEEKCRKDCLEYGIGIADGGILLKGLTYVKSVKEKVEDRMIAERSRIAEKHLSEGNGEYEKIMGEKERDLRQITSEAYREARRIEGEGDAEALRLYAEGFSKSPEFYRFMRTLELYETSLPESTKVIMGTDNPLFELIKGKVSKNNQ